MRVTFNTIRSGQPRPYADTERVVQVKCEHLPWGKTEWEPWSVDEEAARRLAGAVYALPPKRAEAGFLGSYLDYFNPVDPKRVNRVGVEDSSFPRKTSVWEYRIVEPFTD